MSDQLLGIFPIKEAKRIQAALAERGVKVSLVHNSETCESGSCAPSVEARFAAADLETVRSFAQDERARDHGDLEFDPALHDEVFDPTKDVARCPACGASFSTTKLECPECGLGFGEG
jgi:hypothetical protein